MAIEERKPRRSVQRLAESIRSLLGFKAHLTSGWAESVCHIIKQLPSDEPSGSSATYSPSFRTMESSEDKDIELDGTLSKIRDDLAALTAHLNQLNLWRGKALNDFLDLKGNIRVFCRIRPLLPGEKSGSTVPVVALDPNAVLLKFAENKRKQFSFDKVFHPGSSQDEVFSEVEPVIKSALDGYNACIFAYGQTGTGKTFTMEGRADCPGIVPRAIEALFKQALDSNHTFLFTFSMLEIYMGSLRDLLVPQNSKQSDLATQLKTHGDMIIPLISLYSLPIKMNPDGRIEIDNLVAIRVSDFNQAKRLYRLGSRFRSTASTNSNVTSSRSHCLIRRSVTCFDAPERRRETNKLWMVDLGGSERLLKTQARGRRLEEGKAINLSLSALGDVISSLQRKKSHVPYRNSKLTQVLRDSLGEDSKTIMLVHVSPKEEDLCETVCSLGFATRVRSIHLGNEESTEIRARKEVEMAQLLQKVKHLESARQDAKRDIEKLNEKMKCLKPTEPLSKKYLEASNLSHEESHSNIERDKHSAGTAAGASLSRLPRFMRPTASSQQKSGFDCQSSESASKKLPPPARRRKASSVRANSVTFPRKMSQSEYGSDVSVSISKYSAYSETECSQGASECDVKMVIFPKQDKSISSSVCSNSLQRQESIHEYSNRWKDRSDTEKHLTVDQWLRLQKHEPTTTNIHRSRRVLAIPVPGKKSRPSKQNHETTINKAKVLHPVSCADMDLVCEKAHDNDYIEKELSRQEATDEIWSCSDGVKMELCGFDTSCSNQMIKKSELVEERQVHQIEASHQTNVTNVKAVNQDDQTALVLNGNVMRENNGVGDLCGSPPQHMEDALKPCLHLMRSRRSLFTPKDSPIIDAFGDSVVPTIQDIKENRGICHRFGRMVEIGCASALLGMGIQSIGLEHDFFHSLML